MMRNYDQLQNSFLNEILTIVLYNYTLSSISEYGVVD